MAAISENYSGGTFLSNLVTRPEFLPYVQEEIVERSAFIQSGVIQRNSALDITQGGVRLQVPFLQPIDPTEVVVQSNSTWNGGKGYLEPHLITGSSQYASMMHRAFSYAADDLSKLGSGADALAGVRSYLGAAIAKKNTATIVAMLTGLFGGALGSNVLDISENTGGAEYISAASVTAAKALLGERGDSLQVLAVRPEVAYYLEQVGMLQFSTGALASGGAIEWGAGGVGTTQTAVRNFAGLRVVVDSQLPTVDGVHTCYLFGGGVIAQGVQQPLVIKADRNELSFQDILIVRYSQLFHVMGTTWDSGSDNPTNAALATAGNWDLCYDAKLIPAVALKVKSPLG